MEALKVRCGVVIPGPKGVGKSTSLISLFKRLNNEENTACLWMTAEVMNILQG